MTCTEGRLGVSAWLDGEQADGLEDHLATCDDCARFAASAEALRRQLRVEVVGEVPDIAGAVRARLTQEAARPAPPSRRRTRSTFAVAAAALVAGVLIGANLVGVGDDRPRSAVAATLPERVAVAQGAVDGLHEELRLVERGWNPAVPVRTYRGTLDYRAPESLALEWRDATRYPSSAWRANDVTLRTDGQAWSATGVLDCPSAAQPGCSDEVRERAVVDRPPFADDAPVPLELIVPVLSFTRVDTATVVGAGTVAGRPTVEVAAVAAQVGPLLAGLAPAGNLRAVHPTDEVRLALDAQRMIPLRVTVTASGDPDRRSWAIRRGYADHPGLVVLDLSVTSLDLDRPSADRFVPPASEVATDAGFVTGDPVVDLRPAAPEGFTPGREGTILGATPTGVWSWSDGRAWIRLQATASWQGPGLFGDLGPIVRTQTGAAGDVYVSADGRRVGLHGDGVDLMVDGSMGTDALVAVVDALGVQSVELPPDWPEHLTASRAAIRRAVPGALGLVARGFERPVARLDGHTVVQVAVGGGDRTLRLDQVPGDRISQPLELDYDTVVVRGHTGRYAPGSGRLEWVEGDRVLTLRGIGSTRDELVAVAEGLLPL